MLVVDQYADTGLRAVARMGRRDHVHRVWWTRLLFELLGRPQPRQLSSKGKPVKVLSYGEWRVIHCRERGKT
jgi:hypothetical protein